MDADRLRERAGRWFANEIDQARRALGRDWPAHEEWILDYTRAELRERLQRYRDQVPDVEALVDEVGGRDDART